MHLGKGISRLLSPTHKHTSLSHAVGVAVHQPLFRHQRQHYPEPGPFTCPHTALTLLLCCSLQDKASRNQLTSLSALLPPHKSHFSLLPALTHRLLTPSHCRARVQTRPRSAGEQVPPARPPHGPSPPTPAAPPRRRHHRGLVPVTGRRAVCLPLRLRRAFPHLILLIYCRQRSKPVLLRT